LRSMVLPRDLLILALPSVPVRRGTRPTSASGWGNRLGLPVEALRCLPRQFDVWQPVLAQGHEIHADLGRNGYFFGPPEFSPAVAFVPGGETSIPRGEYMPEASSGLDGADVTDDA